MSMNKVSRLFLIAALFVSVVIFCGSVYASQGDQATNKESRTAAKKKKEKKAEGEKKAQEVIIHKEIVVTATRTEKTVFDSPKPVAVIGQTKLEERAPNNVAELLPELPGTDIVGIGANQSRPVIRGLRGQRILLLSDGIRLSNSRRTQSFGEIPAIADVTGMERVEVVRGPASVLYGSEAIGGVLNLIYRVPDYFQQGTNVSGNIGYRFSSADTQHKGFLNINGNVENFGFMVNGFYRNAQGYTAPAGSFGNITLAKDTPVLDSGVQDQNFNIFLGLRISQDNNISIRYEDYRSRDAGFGYIDPAEYSPGDPTIQMVYPDQKMQKLTLKYENRALQFALADGISVTGYYLNNNRLFNTNITIPLFPGAGIAINSENMTDVDTYGTRLELTKVLFNKHVLTYGFDYFQDNSVNTDTNTTEIFGFGPPMIQSDNIPKVPNAFFRSFGAFLQDDISLFKRMSVILGVRYQNVHAETKETEGISDPLVKSTDSTFVGAANFIFRITDNLNTVLSLGRGFRSANLPERFFQGVTPDGAGYQIRNLDLKPETSFNYDLGLRYRLGGFYIEGTYFRNLVSNGIQIEPTGELFGRLKEYKNINVEKLRIQGFEFAGQVSLDFGLSLYANFSKLNSKNLSNPELMYADTYGSRLNLNLRYSHPSNLFFVEYHIRHNGERKDVDLGTNPLGAIIPGFTVHSLRTGITLFKNSAFPQQIGVTIQNLTDTLYAEFSNASFFRPAPKRQVVLTWMARF
ncbi:MAG: TonB-dependent receptor [Candidatus Aminicenantes bacterium]|nr:MAG: TonB-dependent receptor [Candidatus Aminicenantes bacterium]